MANKRMFSKQITTSDAFVEMPVSSQLLYFHLNMEADDDGFVANPKRLIRMLNVGEDDFKILLAKRFILGFSSGVIVIKHWLLHNAVRKDMYNETQYLEEKNTLHIKDNKVYTEARNIPVTEPLHRLDKIRLDKDSSNAPALRAKRVIKKSLPETTEKAITRIIKLFEDIDIKNKEYYTQASQRNACIFLIENYGLEQVLDMIPKLKETNKTSFYQITTPFEMKKNIVKVFNDVQRKKVEVKSKGRGLAD